SGRRVRTAERTVRARSGGSRVRVPAAPLPGPGGEGFPPDRGSHLTREPDQVTNVVQRQQPESQQLLGHEEMAEIAARERGAGLAIAGRVERARIVAVRRVADVDGAGVRGG